MIIQRNLTGFRREVASLLSSMGPGGSGLFGGPLVAWFATLPPFELPGTGPLRPWQMAFLLVGLDRIDPVARGAYGFRPLLLPGLVLLWPWVVLRWARLAGQG